MDLSARWSWFARTFGPAIAIVVAQQILFPSKELNSGAYAWGLVVQGVTLGMLGALVALGMALIYRANRILNFAPGRPRPRAGLARHRPHPLLRPQLLPRLRHRAGRRGRRRRGRRARDHPPLLPVPAADPHRRHDRPRAAARVRRARPPDAVGRRTARRASIDHPDHLARSKSSRSSSTPTTSSRGSSRRSRSIAVALFLRFTDVGIAIRAAADRADRAALLGIPVGRLHTCVWIIAARALVHRAVPARRRRRASRSASTASVSTVLLSALAALMLGRLTNLPAIVASRRSRSVCSSQRRLERLADHRPVPPRPRQRRRHGAGARGRHHRRAARAAAGVDARGERRHVVVAGRRGGPADPARAALAPRGAAWCASSASLLVAAFLLALPYLPWLGRPGNTSRPRPCVIFAIVGMSIMVLTGWAGQVSLGQMASSPSAPRSAPSPRPTGTSTSRSPCR